MKKAAAFLILLSMLSALMGCGTINADLPNGMTESESTTEATQEQTRSEEAKEETPEATIEETQPEATQAETPKTNILVVYFSRTGNTKALAEYAIDLLGADSFEIEAAVPYTDADIAYYTNCRADQEQSDPSARPEIANRIENIGQYDTIVLGYPIWHGQAPRIISSFLESYDFSGKTILPFCTSHSSGIGNSDTNLHDLCSADWKGGKRFSGIGEAAELKAWLTEEIPQSRITEEADPLKNELVLKINDTLVPVTWEKNASTAELAEYVRSGEIVVDMRMYGGWEQVGDLGHTFSSNDFHQTAENGDIMLYCGNQIVLFYGANSWAYTKLGHIDLPSDQVRNLLRADAVTVTLSAQ